LISKADVGCARGDRVGSSLSVSVLQRASSGPLWEELDGGSGREPLTNFGGHALNRGRLSCSIHIAYGTLGAPKTLVGLLGK